MRKALETTCVKDDSGNIIREEGKLPESVLDIRDKDTGLMSQIYDSGPGIYIRATGIMFKEIGMGIGALILGSVGKKFQFKHLSALGFLVSGAVFLLLPLGNRVTSHGFVQAINRILPHVFASSPPEYILLAL